jgi:hypothetical protein
MTAPGGRHTAEVDSLHAAAVAAGESRARQRQLLAGVGDERALVSILRRPVPLALLEEIAASRPWGERPLVLARVVLHRGAPPPLALRLVGSLHWRDLAEVAATMRVPGAVRTRAESLLREALPDLRLGDRLALARVATPALLPPLLADEEPRVVAAALENPRLREEDVAVALRAGTASRALIDGAASSPRWAASYAVRLALVLQPRTPLSLSLHQLSRLVGRDLSRVASETSLVPVVRMAAARLLRGDRD